MIKLENFEVVGWEHALRGMRNPKNSWARSDSTFKEVAKTHELDENEEPREMYVRFDALSVGPNDRELMDTLVKGGPVHAKFRRMIAVYVDITAPLYFWKEFDTYKVGTVANSCSTMHKIADKEFTLDDFSHEHLLSMLSNYDEWKIPVVDLSPELDGTHMFSPHGVLEIITIPMLNDCRTRFIETKDKKYWWQMIQLLPTSYNQKRTVMLNYEVLANMYKWRKNHKLDEWREFCKWVEDLPYSDIITTPSGHDVLYLCDREQCETCDDIDCAHTSDIKHAVNFEKIGSAYWEKSPYFPTREDVTGGDSD